MSANIKVYRTALTVVCICFSAAVISLLITNEKQRRRADHALQLERVKLQFMQAHCPDPAYDRVESRGDSVTFFKNGQTVGFAVTELR